MRFALPVVAALATGAYAQSSACAAQTILDTCLTTTTAVLDNCSTNDWECMCRAQEAVLTCYNNCPGDASRATADNQRISWCGAASQASVQSALTATTTSRSTLATSATTTSADSAATESSAASGSSASASASATGNSNAAAGLVAPVSGVLAIAFGFLGLM